MAGAGGCGGGLVGGGGAGGAGGGGGGGGHGTDGAAGGGGGAGGSIGPAHGTAAVVSYDGVQPDGSDRNQASGGAGGGAAIGATSNPGAGGGGGGSVELTAGGNISCGAISVNGGGGSNGGAIVGAAGGGGGGAGGLVVIRAGGTLTTGALSATPGGAGNGAGGGAVGGVGGFGRVRVDTAGALPTSNPIARRGAVFVSPPAVVTSDNPMIDIMGTTNDVFDMYVIDDAGVPHFGEPMNQMIEASGMKTVVPTLLPGYNRLCLTVRPGTRGEALADKCIDVAYLP
jgi:hypothetical protein